jgi:Tripartite tricarboxylate transporter TctB family
VTRDMQQIAFTAVILIVVSAAVWQAEQWAIKARLFPWVIGIPVIAMLLALLVQQIIRVVRSAPVRAEVGVVEQFENVASAEAAAARRRGFTIVGWLLGFLGAIWLIGFPAGGTLATLGYLKLAAREKWPISLAISAGTALFFFLMINFLNTPFPRGEFFEMLFPVV